MGAVFWKETADYFGSRRFIVLLLMIAFAGVWAAYTATQAIRAEADLATTEDVFLRLFTTSGSGSTLSFNFFTSFFGPLLGMALGFDAINGERGRGTLARILSQPIYRDALINGKFFAGVTVLSIALVSLMLIVIGIGIFTLGFGPTFDEITRLALFFVATLIYFAVWLAIAILFSLLFDRAVVSALASLGMWLVLTFFIFFFSTTIADQIVTDQVDEPEIAAMHKMEWQQRIQRISPAYLYGEATQALLNPKVRTLGAGIQQSTEVMPSPLALGQSVGLVWPQLITLMAIASVVFGIAYVRFMKEEIRF